MSLLSSALVQSLMHVAEAQHLHASYQHLPQVKVPQHTSVLCACVSARSRYEMWGIPRSVFLHSGVPSINALVRTHLESDIHSVRHFVFVFNASLYCIVLRDS